MAAIRIDLPYLSMHVSTGNEVSIPVEGHPVGASRAFQKERYSTGAGVPSVNSVIRLVSEEHIAMPIDRGPFRKTEARCQGNELPLLTR
jgi:hypothetical protein